MAFSQVVSSGCAPSLTETSSKDRPFKIACDRANSTALASIKKIQPRIVVLVQRDKHEKNDYRKISNKLLALGVKDVFILGPVPQWKPSLPRVIALRHWNTNEVQFYDKNFVSELVHTDKQMESLFDDSQPHIKYLSILSSLCEQEKCIAKVDQNNTPLVWDHGHLTNIGASFIFKKVLFDEFENAFKTNQN